MAAGDLTWEELNELSVTELRKIMVYLNLPYDAKTRKNDLVRSIWAVTAPSPVAADGEAPVPRMSVRLERIYKSLGRLP